MTVEGTWHLTIDTPIGRQCADLVLSTVDGSLRGVARDPRHDEEIALIDLVRDGDRLTWGQRVTKPMRLNLTFDVTVTGDEMAGHARAGRLPRSPVTGRRAAA